METPIRRPISKLIIVTAALLAHTSLYAASVDLNFSSTFSYVPDRAIGVGGYSVSDVLEQSFGIVSNGGTDTFHVSGTLTYESDTPPSLSHSVSSLRITGDAAGYIDSIKEVKLIINGTNVHANISDITAQANTASSGVRITDSDFGLANPEIGGRGIQQVPPSLNPIQSGNAALVGNGLPLQVNGPAGQSNFLDARDFLGFTIGTTAATDFSPVFLTDIGAVSVSSLLLGVVAKSNGLWDKTALPSDNLFLSGDDLDTSIIALSLAVNDNFLPALSFTGNIDSVTITAVPIPGAFWLLGSGIVTLFGFHAKRVSRTA